jgi:hypothetical protein
MAKPNSQISTYRRRHDGILEILPRLDHPETRKGAEIAIAVLILMVGGGAALVRNYAMSVFLLAAGITLLASRFLQDRRAARSARRRLALFATLAESNERAPLRVLRE